jgi:hypothetical protein
MSSISRRDFLNGVALSIAAGLTPAAQIAAEPARYPPALTGLGRPWRGSKAWLIWIGQQEQVPPQPRDHGKQRQGGDQ